MKTEGSASTAVLTTIGDGTVPIHRNKGEVQTTHNQVGEITRMVTRNHQKDVKSSLTERLQQTVVDRRVDISKSKLTVGQFNA
jgi:hypothetical protein